MKLSKRTIDAIDTNSDRDIFVWDSDLRGFGVKVSKNGHRTFVLQYRFAGRSRRYSICRVGDKTVKEARGEALRLRAQIANGVDPIQARRAVRKVPTVRELAERYVIEHAIPNKKRSSLTGDLLNLKNHVLPKIGSVRITDLRRQDIAELHHRMKDRPIIANRVLQLLSKMFSLAILWGLANENPVRGVPRFKENRRERFLSEREFARLGQALRDAEQQNLEMSSAIAAIRLLMFTGCRRGEILTLEWGDVDFERDLLWLRDSKTGPRTVPINAPARAVLVALYEKRTSESGWVIGGRHQGKPLVGLHRIWARIRVAAKLPGVRLHDLRHSHASIGAAAGLSLPILGALLGQASPATTARYAHLADDPRRRASDRVGDRIAEILEGGARNAEKASLEAIDGSLAGPRSVREDGRRHAR